MASDPFHERLLQIVKRLPGAVEDWPWGSIHCKVADKIFVGWGRDEAGEMSIGLRTTLELQSMLVASDPRFSIAKYVGKYGGIDMRIGKKPNWNEIEQLIIASYRIIAPKRLVKELDAKLERGPRTTGSAEKPTAKKPAAKKPPAKKPAAKSAVAEKPRAKKPATKKPATKKPRS
jgi:predicted DNA-binding protein (MmcQ/YjbR family)